MEKWKKIKGYDGYFVSNLGYVKNKKGILLKFVHEKVNYGYVRVALWKNKKDIMLQFID